MLKELAKQWLLDNVNNAEQKYVEYYSRNRDVFYTRNRKMLQTFLEHSIPESIVYISSFFLFMKIQLIKFCDFLSSRPSGREAFLVIQSTFLSELSENEKIEIDFDGIKVLTPSWMDEVLTPLSEKYPDRIKLLNETDNPTVKNTLETLREFSDLSIS